MKKLSVLINVLLLFGLSLNSQTVERHSPPDYDTPRTGIAHGKIDTISYMSNTVGVNRRAIIYTPPGYLGDMPGQSGGITFIPLLNCYSNN